MGYRSQAVLVVGKEVMPQFLATMAKSPEARRLCWSDHDKMMKDYDGEGNILFAWSYIKWYEGYEPVDAISDFMDWCDGEDVPIGEKDEEGKDKTDHATEFFKFIRIGEEMDDNEQRGDAFWGDICINRSIEF